MYADQHQRAVRAHARTSTVRYEPGIWAAWCVCGAVRKATTADRATTALRRHCAEANGHGVREPT